MSKIIASRVNIMISNMDTSIDFYTNKLGLKLLNQYGNHYAEIQAPDLLIGLHQKNHKTVVGNNISIGFGVKEFDTMIINLREKGVDITIEEDGWIRLAYFFDLDQNQLLLAENKD